MRVLLAFLYSLLSVALVYATSVAVSQGTPSFVPAKWRVRLTDIASDHTQVAGVLAGFSVTVVVLLIGSRMGRQIGERLFDLMEETAAGLFIASFYGYIATGILYSVVGELESNQQYFLFCTTSFVYYKSVTISFVAVRLLVRRFEYKVLELPIFVTVIGVVMGGYMAAMIPVVQLLDASLWVVGLMFLTALGIVCLIRELFKKSLKSKSFMQKSIIVDAILVALVFAICMMTFFGLAPRDTLVSRMLSVAVALPMTTAALWAAVLPLPASMQKKRF